MCCVCVVFVLCLCCVCVVLTPVCVNVLDIMCLCKVFVCVFCLGNSFSLLLCRKSCIFIEHYYSSCVYVLTLMVEVFNTMV